MATLQPGDIVVLLEDYGSRTLGNIGVVRSLEVQPNGQVLINWHIVLPSPEVNLGFLEVSCFDFRLEKIGHIDDFREG